VPTQRYTVQGKRVPSVTTILGKFKDPGALMYWSWDIAYQQLTTAVYLLKTGAKVKEVKSFLATNPLELGNYRAMSARAAEAGTVAHRLVEIWIHASKGEKLNLAKKSHRVIASEFNVHLEIAEKARSSFQAFLKWEKLHKIKVKQTEAALISTSNRYGGCIDCIAELDGDLVILDWKTSKAVYSDYICQLAAYGLLWNENHPDNQINSYHLLRFDKETADFHHHQFRKLDGAAEMFLLFRRCYELQAELEKRIK